MSNALVGFLAKLATDPDFYAQYQKNPDEVMSQSGLSAPEMAALETGNAAKMVALIVERETHPSGKGGFSPPVAGSAGAAVSWVPVLMYIPVAGVSAPGTPQSPLLPPGFPGFPHAPGPVAPSPQRDWCEFPPGAPEEQMEQILGRKKHCSTPYGAPQPEKPQAPSAPPSSEPQPSPPQPGPGASPKKD